jgi:type II secretory ATPase GspE/PulE/Tfp pilus assembly ATPase PilB-like protein
MVLNVFSKVIDGADSAQQTSADDRAEPSDDGSKPAPDTNGNQPFPTNAYSARDLALSHRDYLVQKFAYLLDRQLLNQAALKKAATDAEAQKKPIESMLMKDLGIAKEAIGESLSRYYDVPFEQYNDRLTIPGELLQGMKVSFMQKNRWVPLGMADEKIIIAISDPHDLQKADMIRILYPGKQFVFRVALEPDILRYIDLFTAHDELYEMDSILSQLQVDDEELEDIESQVDEEDSIVIQLANKLILHAYDRNASDIHIEPYPGRKGTRIRFRVDGYCYLYQTIPYHYKYALASRIKIMASLDIAERRKPQDGKIKFKGKKGQDIELRVSTVPTQGGLEDVVMRIVPGKDPMPLDQIGVTDRNHANFVSAIHRPYGLILVCGPTGSGKTTTLHSALGRINTAETKIWTAEDPVEITQDGLRQVQVMPKIGFDFAAALRAFLRSDPDVIMVGEMRDRETAHIGIEASLTGHLVLSTLHTNGAVESIARLLDMGLDSFNFADAILCILAQRLVLTLCDQCKEPYHPTAAQYEDLLRQYGREAFAGHVNIPYSDDGHGADEEADTGEREDRRHPKSGGSRRHDDFEAGRYRQGFRRQVRSVSGEESLLLMRRDLTKVAAIESMALTAPHVNGCTTMIARATKA